MNQVGELLDQRTGIQVGAPCAHCMAPHSGIGGRNKEGGFVPLYQEKYDRIAAAKMIGKYAWCGHLSRDLMCRVRRIVCTAIEVDGETEIVCQRCARELTKARVIEIDAA